MDLSEDEFCKTVCFSESKCDWTGWNNPTDHEFPDGTCQTCVGAHVRCGCTTTLKLISYVSYEHPSAVTVLFLIFVTAVFVMLIKCMVDQQDYGLFCCGYVADLMKHERCVSSASRNSEASEVGESNGDTGRNISSPVPNCVQIYLVESEKPPPYSYVMKQEIDSLPPSYVECMQMYNKDEKSVKV